MQREPKSMPSTAGRYVFVACYRETKLYPRSSPSQDIEITYFGTFAHHDGRMFCGTDHSISCDIAADEWSCLHRGRLVPVGASEGIWHAAGLSGE